MVVLRSVRDGNEHHEERANMFQSTGLERVRNAFETRPLNARLDLR